MNRPKDFRDAAQMEMRNERQTILNAMKANRAGSVEEDGNGGKEIETIPVRELRWVMTAINMINDCNW